MSVGICHSMLGQPSRGQVEYNKAQGEISPSRAGSLLIWTQIEFSMR